MVRFYCVLQQQTVITLLFTVHMASPYVPQLYVEENGMLMPFMADNPHYIPPGGPFLNLGDLPQQLLQQEQQQLGSIWMHQGQESGRNNGGW
jgi:hypothetical protein